MVRPVFRLSNALHANSQDIAGTGGIPARLERKQALVRRFAKRYGFPTSSEPISRV